MKKLFYKFLIRSIQNTSQQQTKSQSKQKFKISKTSTRTRRTKKIKTIQTNETDFFSNDDANDSMIVNNDFFVEQYSEQFVTFFARNISVRSELNSHKSRQNSLFSFFLINRIFKSFFKYAQWTRQNASAIFRENKKKFKNYDKKNAILINSKTYAKIMIIKTNKITKMRKFFLHKYECLAYLNKSI